MKLRLAVAGATGPMRAAFAGIALAAGVLVQAGAVAAPETSALPPADQGGAMTGTGGVGSRVDPQAGLPLPPSGGERAMESEVGGDGTSAAPRALSERQPFTVEQARAAMAEADKRRLELRQPDPAVADPEIRKEFLEKWGVEVVGITRSARGYMADFRFRVLDSDKALPLFDGKIPPYLIPDGTSIKLPVPMGEKVGAFRTTNRGKNIQSGKDYHIIFANPDAFVKPGQKVSVIIGDFRAEHLTLK